MNDTTPFGKSSGAQNWLVLVEFSAAVTAGQQHAAQGVAPGGLESIHDRLVEILRLLNIPDARLSRIQSAVENAVLHAAGRLALRDPGAAGQRREEQGAPNRAPGVSVQVLVSRRSPGEEKQAGEADAGGEPAADPWRATVPIWTGGPYGWGFFLVEKAWGVPAWGDLPDEATKVEVPPGGMAAPGEQNPLIQLFLYPEGGPEPEGE